MSKLNELIQQLCPDGVEYKPLGEVCILSRGKVYSKDYLKDNPGEFPVYSSQTANNGELGKINTYDCEGDYLTWTTDGAHAGTIFHRTGKFSITNVCGLIKIKESNLYIRFLYYWLSIKAKGYVNQGMGNPKLMTNQIEVIPIPLPPLTVQEEIVRLLDALTETTQKYQAEQEAELDARKKQYEEYRDQLLDFEGKEGVEMKTLGEVCEITDYVANGSFASLRENVEYKQEPDYALLVRTVDLSHNFEGDKIYINEHAYNFLAKSVLHGGEIIINNIGAGVGKTFRCPYLNVKMSLAPNSIMVRTTNNDFYYYWFSSLYGQTAISKIITPGAMPKFNKTGLKTIVIPIPSKEEQSRIVNILSRMDKTHKELCQSIETEIKMRKQQYEYYRNQLLDFKKKED